MSTVETKRSYRDTIMAYLDAPEHAGLSDAKIASLVSAEVGTTVHEGSVYRARKARQAQPARVVVDVPLDLIDLDPRTQMRTDLDGSAVRAYREVLDDLPPIELVRNVETGRYWLGHGHHRYQAHRHTDAKAIPAYVVDGTIEDAIEIAIGANADQVPRCEATKANAVRAFMALHPEASVNAAAKAAHVSWELANSVIAGHTSIVEARKAKPTKLAPAVDRGSTREEDEDEDGDDEPWAAPSQVENPPSTNGHASSGKPAPLPAFSEEDEFLEGCHLSSKLTGSALTGFKADALLYFRTRETRKAFADQFRHHAKAAPMGMPNGAYYHRIRSALEINHPKDWTCCLDCHGEGCGTCKNRGYHVS